MCQIAKILRQISYVCFSENIEFTRHSTGSSFENHVDGLPGALHTEAVWGGQGVFGPAPIDTLDKKKDRKCLKR